MKIRVLKLFVDPQEFRWALSCVAVGLGTGVLACDDSLDTESPEAGAASAMGGSGSEEGENCNDSPGLGESSGDRIELPPYVETELDLCTCADGAYSVTLNTPEGSVTFDEPASYEYPSAAFAFCRANTPSGTLGGSCLPTIISACSVVDGCLSVDSKGQVNWTREQENDIEATNAELTVTDKLVWNSLSGTPHDGTDGFIQGSFAFTGAGVPYSGTFKVCAIGADFCLK